MKLIKRIKLLLRNKVSMVKMYVLINGTHLNTDTILLVHSNLVLNKTIQKNVLK